MGLSEDVFYRSPLKKIIFLLEKYKEEQEALAGIKPKEKEKPKTARTFSEIIKGGPERAI